MYDDTWPTRQLYASITQCWTSVTGNNPTINKYWVDVPCVFCVYDPVNAIHLNGLN